MSAEDDAINPTLRLMSAIPTAALAIRNHTPSCSSRQLSNMARNSMFLVNTAYEHSRIGSSSRTPAGEAHEGNGVPGRSHQNVSRPSLANALARNARLTFSSKTSSCSPMINCENCGPPRPEMARKASR